MLPGMCDDLDSQVTVSVPKIKKPRLVQPEASAIIIRDSIANPDEAKFAEPTAQKIKIGSLDQPSPNKFVLAPKINHENSEDDPNANKVEENELKKSIRLFAERVSIAGLEDLYKSIFLPERWMWYLAIIAVFAGVTLKCINKSKEYENPSIQVSTYSMANLMPPFPNVSICGPMSVNKEKFKDLLIIPQKVKNLITRKNLNLLEIIDFTLDFWRYDLLPVEIDNLVIAKASLQIIDASVVRYPRGMVDLFMDLYPSCQESLAQCFFYGQAFDCCQMAQFTFTLDSICYNFDVNKLNHLLQFQNAFSLNDEPSKLESNGLSIQFNFNWPSIYQDVMQNGFLISIDFLTEESDPVAIPAGADAIVTLSATKIERVIDCRQEIKNTGLEFFEGYAPTAAIVRSNNYLRLSTKFMGCDMPLLTHMPEINSTPPVCMPDMLYAAKTNGAVNSKLNNDAYKAKAVGAANKKGLLDKEKPLCKEWTYKVKSAGYANVQYKNGQENQNSTEESWQWSRMRIFFPQASYTFVEEESTSSLYIALCNVGGSMTMYIGVSMVSFFHVTIYGGYVLYVMYKQMRKKDNQTVLENNSEVQRQ